MAPLLACASDNITSGTQVIAIDAGSARPTQSRGALDAMKTTQAEMKAARRLAG